MSKVVDIKTKEQVFPDWWREVSETNFKHSTPKSVLIIWEDEKGVANHCRYNCDFNTMDWFFHCLEDRMYELKFDKWIREHLDEYIEYLNS